MRVRFLTCVLLALYLLGCSDNSDIGNNILVERVPRKILVNDLIKSGMSFYQEGQTISIIVPYDKLFLNSSSASTINSSEAYKDLVSVINTFRVENLQVSAISRRTDTNYDSDIVRNRSQAAMSNLKRYGLKAPVTLSKGELFADTDSQFGLNLDGYIKIEFRYLRILV
jgi:hypothetical protein